MSHAYDTLQGCLMVWFGLWFAGRVFTTTNNFFKTPVDTDGDAMNNLTATDIFDLINLMHSKMCTLGCNTNEVKDYAIHVISNLVTRNNRWISDEQVIDINHRITECFR